MNNYNLGLKYIKSYIMYFNDKKNADYNKKISDTLNDIYNLIESGNKLNDNEKQLVFKILTEACLLASKK